VKRDEVLAEVREERGVQDARWGEQNHPNGTGEEYSDLAASARIACNTRAVSGVVTWADIFLEEALEACAEQDDEKLRAELVQVAAVAVAWIEAIDRKECPSTLRAPADYPRRGLTS